MTEWKGRWLGAFAMTAALVSLTGCPGDDDPDGNRTGNLGQGAFVYRCVDTETDAACLAPARPSSCTSVFGCAEGQDPAFPETFPAAIAEGSRFGLQFRPSDSKRVGQVTLRPAGEDYLETPQPNEFVARLPGRAAVIARATTDGAFVDYTMVRVAPASAIAIREPSYGTRAGDGWALTLGDAPSFGARAEGPAREELAGALLFTWTSSAPEIVSVETPSPSGRARVQARQEGTAILTATLGALQASVVVTVTP